jgi:hypothetical protein
MRDSQKAILTNNYFAEHAIEIGEVLQLAVREALLMHKRIGNPVAIWKDGRVVIIPPEEIVIPPNDSETEK